MEVQVRWVQEVPVVEVIGEIDAHTCPELRQRIIELVDGGRTRLVVSLSRVNYIDSTGLGTLVGALKRAVERDGAMALVITNPQIMKVLDITGLMRVFQVYERELDAVRRISELMTL